MTQILAIHLAGRVQGVFFRASAQRQAEALNLTGFVRNLPDGSVYLEAAGDPAGLQTFLAWCRQGPRLARVDSISVTPQKTFSEPVLSGFSIL